MKYIKIKNSGLMEPEALTLIGASTKVGDNKKIGQFGSGNKYALAYFLRNNHDVKIYSGLLPIKIKLVDKEFRGEQFKVIHVNNEPTSITTQMGKDWHFWQAIREIYCNAIDEGNSGFSFVNEPEPVENETHFYISANSMAHEFVSNFDNYFATNKKVLFECEEGRILEKTGEHANIYRKGIKCLNSNKHSLYDYDFNDVRIDENRLISYYWEAEEKIWGLLFKCTDKTIIKNVMQNIGDTNFIEGSLSDISSIHAGEMSNEFKEFIKETRIAPLGMSGLLSTEELAQTLVIPTKIFKSVRPHVSEENISEKFRVSDKGHSYRIDTPSALQGKILTDALYFLKEAGFDIPYTVEYALCDNKQVMGLADRKNKIIIITDIGIEHGVSQVVTTIIEEYIHIKHNADDCTRSFQNASINEFVSYMKKINSFAI